MFDINWTKKTKIVIDGKDSDGDGIPDIAEPLSLDPAVPVALPDGLRLEDRGGERPGSQLSKGQAILVVFLADPTSLFDEVAMHVADQRDGTAKAYSP